MEDKWGLIPEEIDIPKEQKAVEQREIINVDPNEAMKRAINYLAKLEPSISGENGQNQAYKVGALLINDFNLTLPQALQCAFDWNQRCTPPWSLDELEIIFTNAERYARGEKGNKLIELEPIFDDGDLERQDHKYVYYNKTDRFYTKDGNGNWELEHPKNKEQIKNYIDTLKIMSVKDVNTLINKRNYLKAAKIECNHNMPALFKNDVGELVINSYKKPNLQEKEGNFDRIRKIQNELVDGDGKAVDYIDNWLAYKVQNPNQRNLTALLFQGAPGSGKSTFLSVLKEIIGHDNTYSINQSSLNGNFNGSFGHKLLIFAEEVFTKENRIDDVASKLKAWIADPKIDVNQKNIVQYQIDNCMSWIFATNKSDPISVERYDRRFSIFGNMTLSSPKHKEMLFGIYDDRNNFTQGFYEEIRAYAYYLKNYKCDFDRVRKPYENKARDELIIASQDSITSFVSEIEQGNLPMMIDEYLKVNETIQFEHKDYWSTEALYFLYRKFCKEHGFIKACGRDRFGNRFISVNTSIIKDKKRILFPSGKKTAVQFSYTVKTKRTYLDEEQYEYINPKIEQIKEELKPDLTPVEVKPETISKDVDWNF